MKSFTEQVTGRAVNSFHEHRGGLAEGEDKRNYKCAKEGRPATEDR